MQFVLSEDQDMLRETALSFMRDEVPVSHLRALRDGGTNTGDEATAAKLAELGFLGVLVPEAHGGSEFGMVGMGQIMEAAGRTLAATPLLQTGVIGASLLALGGNEAQKAEWLPKIVSGEVKTALALDEGAHHAPLAVSTEAERNGQGFSLTGDKKYVQDGHTAELLIVAARTFGEAGNSHGLSLFLVPVASEGVFISPLNTVDSHGAAHITLTGVVAHDEALIGELDKGWELLEPVLDRARAALAAEMLGTAEAAFEMTLEYLQTRRQFGQLIGSFQGLQHRAAKLFTELEMTRSCVAAALDAIDNEKQNVAELTSLAKARASETLHIVSNETIQFHGGIGMTDDHDAGLFLKRARVQEALFGGAAFHRDRYARINNY